MKYLMDAASTRTTPQSEPIPGTAQVENSAGGYAWQADDFDRLERFLVLGSEGGTYYAAERSLTRENADVVRRCLDENGPRTVQTIAAVSRDGRAPKNDPAIYALAMACAHSDERTRKAAFEAVPVVCRIGTHLFHFAAYVEQFRGWGRGLRKAVGSWYERDDVDQLAYQAIKYRQRDGWSHRDLLRLSHPAAPTPSHKLLYEWICGRDAVEGPRVVTGFKMAQEAATAKETAKLVREFNLPREALQPDHLNTPEVWEALLENMPMTALIRNLATITRVGLLTPMGDTTAKVCEQITDEERLRKARVHPIAVLAALVTYAQGHGARGRHTWTPTSQVVDALDAAFYKAFDNVEPTNKRTVLALDVSGSMGMGEIAGIPGLTPRVGAGAMAMVTAAVESRFHMMAFSHQLVDVTITPRARLDDVVRSLAQIPMGGTDCALPMLDALERGIEADVFVVYTDSETWAGRMHPAQALQTYREKTGIPAKLIVVGMVSSGFSIADPDDGGMLDVVGFDTAAPNVMGDFIRS